MCHMYIWYSQKPELDNRSPGNGVMHSCELLCGARNRTQELCKSSYNFCKAALLILKLKS